ncbi:MAG: tetratricopeptide repeat protein [Acidobacteriaceae bacterium]
MATKSARSAKRNQRASPQQPVHHGFRGWCATHPRLLFGLLSAVWVLLLYRNALLSPFVYDDISQVQQNPALLSWAGVLRYWSHAVPFTSTFLGSGGSYYRPIYWLSLGVDRALWGIHAPGFHFTNLAVHWANGLLVFLLWRELRVSLLISAAASLLWLCLPINSEVVIWIAARAYSLMACALLLGLLCAEWYLRARKPLALACYFVAGLCALLAHEEGILLLPLTLLLPHFFPTDHLERAPRRAFLPLCATGIGAAAVYFLLRHAAGGKSGPGSSSLLTIGLAFLKYLQWMVLPVRMSVERSTDLPVSRISFPAVGAILLVLLLLGVIVWLRYRSREAATGLLWMCLALLPFCGIVFIYQGMAERFDYVASLGFALAIAALAYRERGHWRDLVLGCVVLWALWGVWRLEARVDAWRDPATLYEASLKATPRSVGMLVNLGDIYLQRGDTGPAKDAYERALSLRPDYIGAMINLGAVYQQMGDRAAAAREYQRAISLAPAEEGAYANLGALLFAEGKADQAIQQFTKATELNPSDATAYYDLGAIYQNLGQRDQAIRMYQKVLALRPNDPETLANLARLRGGK